MNGFKDHFSGHAALYRDARPSYPDALFAWLANQAPDRYLAWDCATGNGQAALGLARHFRAVIATDASAEQITQAEAAPGIEYRTASAESCGLADASVDLVVVAQAAHWFDLPAFATEVARVLKPDGMVALWCYGLLRISPSIDALVTDFYTRTVGPWWPPERRHVENGYRDLALPFTPLDAPAFTMQTDWSRDDLLRYIGTWSAARRCQAETGRDVVAELAPALAEAWDAETRRRVSWPLALRCWRH